MIITEKAIDLWERHVDSGAEIPEDLEVYDKEVDYVGPNGFKAVALLVPATICEIDINFAGFWHDRLYEVGGGIYDRWYADWLFYRVILSLLWPELAGLKLVRGMLRALIYWRAVRRLGPFCFNYHRKRNKK